MATAVSISSQAMLSSGGSCINDLVAAAVPLFKMQQIAADRAIVVSDAMSMS